MTSLKKLRELKMIEQKGRCYYCDLPVWDNSIHPVTRQNHTAVLPTAALRCTAEHLIARCDGGKNTLDNVVAACFFCNSRRHKRKYPLCPEKYRKHVRTRMSAGKWLSFLKLDVTSQNVHLRRK